MEFLQDRPDFRGERTWPLEPEALPQLGLLAHLHDYFRYGDPDAAGSLECYLQEAGTGLHAESLLDEVAELVKALGELTRDVRGAA
jgi:hypothetical protein